jgi:hypothetical protein
MELTEQLMAIAILVDFLFGVLIGVVLAVSYASRVEDHRYSLLTAAPNSMCDGARAVLGVYVRGGHLYPGLHAGRRGTQSVPSGRDPGRLGKDPVR